MALTIWHNPRCSTSRATLALLTERGLTPEIRLYLQHPPSEAELTHLLTLLDLPVSALIRSKEPLWRELALPADAEDDLLIATLADYPMLIERPIVISGTRAAIGRPPEFVLTIL
jgi:arsenate reductase